MFSLEPHTLTQKAAEIGLKMFLLVSFPSNRSKFSLFLTINSDKELNISSVSCNNHHMLNVKNILGIVYFSATLIKSK
ncbi:MAG: hypothetical protein D8M57_01295 [Candidatus Scalindua sp. AMX11]|nr:MAG: hypothetical protein DWQ00_15275 [Candidatus Scalindua sp.]TDE66702.1 MAG: hypothetical protein D8M57_01295 [Candidatus Scalindua sp. AMX11]GJQ58009.1 MAG: hypothetical protein SCALA701_08100 [Candidatus Scalindua sp.]